MSIQYYTPAGSTVATGIIAISPLTISHLGQEFGMISSFLPAVTDIDHGSSVKGYAFSSAAADASGHHWQYSADNGVTWVNMDSAGTSAALFLNPTDLIRWSGAKGTNTALAAVAVDNTEVAVFDTTSTGHLNVTTRGGSTPYSAAVASLAATVAPVVVDLNHDGTISYTTETMDLNGNGHLYNTAWAASTDGVLVLDKFHDGLLHDSSQFAFTQYGGETDLQGLAVAFDTNHDGKLNVGDAAFNDFRIWHDANGNGKVDAGEMVTLQSVGITSIDLASNGIASTPAAGVSVAGHSSATLADGGTMLVADAAFTYNAAEATAGNATAAAVSTGGLGNAGSNLIMGGPGSDTLVSGFGTDTFKWHLGDQGTTAEPAKDVVTNSDASLPAAGGDVLDLRDVLVGEIHAGGGVGNLANYLHFRYDATTNTTTINVQSHAAGVDEVIALQGVNLVGTFTTDQQVIQDLLTKGKLITD
jgi:hypothetical protein